jgi:surface protein
MGIIAASRLRAAVVSPEFIIEVNTANTGVSNNNQFQFTGALGNYDVVAKQGGVIVQTFNNLNSEETITFSDGSGIYILEITPNGAVPITRLNFSNHGDKLKIIDIKQWGTMIWSTVARSFFGCSNLFITATDYPDLSNCDSLQQMFHDAKNANPDTTNWDVSNITNMTNTFNASAFNGNVSNWDVSNVTNMKNMFRESLFNQPLNNWQITSLTRTFGMFLSAPSFNQPLDNWDTSSITNMDYMFRGAGSFNRDLSGWCVSQISSEPIQFDLSTSSWVLPNSRPIWGTCP